MSRNFLERVLQRGRNGKTRAESSPPRHCFFSMVTDEESLRAVSPEGGKRAVKHGKGGPMRKRGGGGARVFFRGRRRRNQALVHFTFSRSRSLAPGPLYPF